VAARGAIPALTTARLLEKQHRRRVGSGADARLPIALT